MSLKNLDKYKAYKGRIFLLRNRKQIPGTYQKIIGRQKIVLFNTKENFGEAVFIYDETNTRVQVATLKNKYVWIPKNCLLQELEVNEQENKIIDLIDDIINSNINNKKKAVITQLLRNLI